MTRRGFSKILRYELFAIFAIFSRCTFVNVHCSSQNENYRLTESFFVIIPNRDDFALAQ